jgi:predicted Fe-Mo cluster-binding NifX family protein
MKIAVTSTGNQAASAMDTRFGRTRWFMVTDPETGVWEAHANEQNMKAAGIGIFFCEGGTVVEALGLYRQGRLSQADQADVEGHWS